MTLKILDLFSGIGTFSYAFDQIEHNGEKVFETVAFCEIDKDCHRVLKKHWPNVPIFTDVSKIKTLSENLIWQQSVAEYEGKIDIIVGGFPCTDISVAGKQKGLFDENGQATRSGLWSQYKRLIQEIKPKYVVIENVRALLSNGIGTVLKDLSEIGYDAEWEIISARDVGQCHLRERIWIVAYPNSNTIRVGPEWATTRRDNLQSSGETEFGNLSETGKIESPNLHNFRFWLSFATEEEKRQWWTETTAQFRDWRQAQPELCGVYDGPTTGLHEKFRRGRIKQLGNGIIRSIAQIHAERIKYHEFNEESFL